MTGGEPSPAAKPALAELALGDPPEHWAALGFTVAAGAVALGGVTLRLGAHGAGIVSWSLSGIAPAAEIDGLPTRVAAPPATAAPAAGAHGNGAVGLDHVVVLTPDFDRTTAALDAAGMPLRRIRSVGEGADAFRQGFRRLGPAILELVEARDAPAGPARFWGLVAIVSDLDAAAARLGEERCAAPRPAVQPGRRIATLRRAAGLSMPFAFMDPEPAA